MPFSYDVTDYDFGPTWYPSYNPFTRSRRFVKKPKKKKGSSAADVIAPAPARAGDSPLYTQFQGLRPLPWLGLLPTISAAGVGVLTDRYPMPVPVERKNAPPPTPKGPGIARRGGTALGALARGVARSTAVVVPIDIVGALGTFDEDEPAAAGTADPRGETGYERARRIAEEGRIDAEDRRRQQTYEDERSDRAARREREEKESEARIAREEAAEKRAQEKADREKAEEDRKKAAASAAAAPKPFWQQIAGALIQFGIGGPQEQVIKIRQPKEKTGPIPVQGVAPEEAPLTSTELESAQCPCPEKPKRQKRERQTRTRCYRGTYIERSTGLQKSRGRKVPCRPSNASWLSQQAR